MDILSSTHSGNSRTLALALVLIMGLVAFAPALPMIWSGDIEDGTVQAENVPMDLQPGQRRGDHYLDTSPSEYLATGVGSNSYFGVTMNKLDFNGDGIMDLAVSEPGKTRVSIFDGSYQLKFPELQVTSTQARWTFTGGQYFGGDFDVGDVDGDGADDLLVVAFIGSYPYGYLYYGGAYVNQKTSFSSANATFICQSYGYYGPWVGLGDTDGDGYDDVWVGTGGYYYEQWYNYGGYTYYYKWYYGEAKCWYGRAVQMSGSWSYTTANLDIKPSLTYTYSYSNYYYYEYYNDYLGMGGVSLGDMNGDGREEIAFGCPQRYNSQNEYYNGAVIVMYPRSNIRSASTLEAMKDNSYADWVAYVGSSNYMCVGADPLIYDYNGDGLGDLTFCTGYMSSSYPDNGKYVWMVDGSTTIPTGTKKLSSASSYSRRLYSRESTIFGSHAFGDIDGDGLVDLAVGSSSPGKVYILLNKHFAGKTGTIEVSAISVFTIHAPSGGQAYFAYPGYYWRYYYYPYYAKYRPICFWNRDNDGLDDIFVSNSYAAVKGAANTGAVYGISNFDMFGIGRFDSTSADPPNHETLYAEHSSYGFRGSAWNKWNIFGTTMTWDFIVGNYHAIVKYSNTNGTEEGAVLEVLDDYWGILRVDTESVRLTRDISKDTLYVDFKVLFTMNLPVEGDLDVSFTASAAHIAYNQMIPDVGKVRNRFKYVGELEVTTDPSWYVPGGRDATESVVRSGAWLSENTTLKFTGMRLVYNGTEDFLEDEGIEPFYPRDEFFKMVMVNTLGYTAEDNTSSGRDFMMMMNAGSLPIGMVFDIEQVGIPLDRMINRVDPFKVRVDTDTPTAPPGIQVHADAFDDGNTIVDNDGELYVTWNLPGEYNSGVDHYLVECTGGVEPVEAESTFAKIHTTSVGEIEVTVRAVDRVGHVGPVGRGSIYIDNELLSFGSFWPVEGEWMNTLSPLVGVRVEDVGGRAVVGSSIEYTVSVDDGVTYGLWESAGYVLNSKFVDVRVSPLFMEGSANLIRFRAADEAGNVMESGTYRVSVDISGCTFEDVRVDGEEGWEGEWMAGPTVDVELGVEDRFSGVDGSTVQYRSTMKTRADLETEPWEGVGVLVSGGEVRVEVSGLEVSKGDGNYVQFRAKDAVGNGYSYSEAYNIWVNTLPEVVISSPEDGSEYDEGEVVLFGAEGTKDRDGDDLVLTWMDEVTFGGETTTVELGVGGGDGYGFELELGPGTHVITLTVEDGLHTVVSEPVVVVVEERIEPVWLSMEDGDGDGMPNYWEYAYHLPWDNATNKDRLYDPAVHSGISREELYRLLESRYANGTVEVTAGNDNDGDGHTDFEEYLSGYDPTNALDYPVYRPEGESEAEVEDIFLLVLVIACGVVLVLVMALIVLNANMIRSRLRDEEVREAGQEARVMEDRMLAGGRDRLAALRSASEGRPVSLPGVVPVGAALPAAPSGPVPVQAVQPEAMPMAATPMEAQPTMNYQGPGGQ